MISESDFVSAMTFCSSSVASDAVCPRLTSEEVADAAV
jgi:hypothetical protein